LPSYAAAGRPGYWNTCEDTVFRALDGQPIAAYLSPCPTGTFVSAGGGPCGETERLLGDFVDLIDVVEYWTVSGLEDGPYRVIIYAWRPGSCTWLWVIGATPGGAYVGGSWGGQLQLGVTHAEFDTEVTGGFLTFEAVGGFACSGALNGIQLVSLDCNRNGVRDAIDIALGTSVDCDSNGYPDECEPVTDCNHNGHADFCDIGIGQSLDCNENHIPDECEPSTDCNGNGIADICDIANCLSEDCNQNGVADECEDDCNRNGLPDDCDLRAGTSRDCNNNGALDDCDIESGASRDEDDNGVPDECQVTREVPSARYPSIQSAIDAAGTGDTILVADGTYIVGLRFRGKLVTLRSRNGPAKCVLDGGGRWNILVFSDGETQATRVEGFTIRNGGNLYNAAIYTYRSSPTIRNCVIMHNHSGWEGGGIFFQEDSRPTLEGCVIAGNTAEQGGGGLYALRSNARIDRCVFVANESNDTGSAVRTYDADVSMTNTLVLANAGGGAAVFAENGSHLIVRASTIVYNAGSGLVAWAGSSVIVGSSIVWGNSGYQLTGDNADVVFSDIQLGWPGVGNVEYNPLFVRIPDGGGDGWGDDPATPGVDEGANDDYGDLRLKPGSPAINTGDPSFVPQPGETDLDGHARVLCGRVDMGAYEFGIGDYDCDQSVDMADLAAWDSCMGGPGGAELRITNYQLLMTNSESRKSEPQRAQRTQRGEGQKGKTTRPFSVLSESSVVNRSMDLRFESGPGAPGSTLRFDNPCAAFDFDGDGDTDLRDFAGFQRVFGGK